jgi:hypothetical protein
VSEEWHIHFTLPLYSFARYVNATDSIFIDVTTVRLFCVFTFAC